MKQYTCLFFLILSSTFAFAQTNENIANGRNYGNFEIGDTSFTLVADANIRDKPATSGAVVAKLTIGTPLKIENTTTDSLTIKGVRAPWYQVSFMSDNKKKTGYLWGGFIASVFIHNVYGDNELYLGGLASFDEKNFKLVTQLRIAKNGQQLAALEFPTCGDVSYSPVLELNGDCGFTNVKQAISYGANFGACDYPNGEYLLFWTKNNQLQHIFATTSSSGAGTGYASENYILPSQRGGINNHILYTEDSAAMEEKGESFVIRDQKYKVVLWKWNGTKLVKVQ
ncbi:MAG: SH3 domain-containing protein [Saprospiraceae bacterium]|nr:SH3 domain-containing protein [Saprospiraceae bacterium]